MTAPLAAHLDLATLERDPYPAFAALQAHGVPAARIFTSVL